MIPTLPGHITQVCINHECELSEYHLTGIAIVTNTEHFNEDEKCEKCGHKLWSDIDESLYNLSLDIGQKLF